MGEEDWEKVRTLRVREQLWRAFGDACTENGTDRSHILRRFMAAYAGLPGATMPRRRRKPTTDNAAPPPTE